MRRLPSFSGVRAFEAAGRLGSFAQASLELNLTPSAISHQVRAFETACGRALFLRHGRRVELTEVGARLLTRLTHTLDEIEAACLELRGATARLTLHCAPSFASEWLGPRLAGFMLAHPDIAIGLSASAEPIDLLRREESDLSIVYSAPPTRSGLETEALGTERIVAMVAPGHALEAIEGMVLIESARSPVGWEEWFALNGLPAPGRGLRPSFDRAAMAIAAAVQGVGAVLESTRLAEARLMRGELVELAGRRPIEREMHFLCYRSAQRDSRAIGAFRTWLLAAIRESDQAISGGETPFPAT